jgi:hypothetical protein
MTWLAISVSPCHEVVVTFPEGPLGVGFVPLDWERGQGAQVW